MNNVVSYNEEAKKRKPLPIMRCSECGATTHAACHCGAPYVRAGELAKEAVKRNPEMSDRAIAEKIGVGYMTIAKARKTTALKGAVNKRLGKDGKLRKMPQPKKKSHDQKWREIAEKKLTPAERWEETLCALAIWSIKMEENWTADFGDWRRFTPTVESYKMVKRASEAWTKLLNSLVKKED
jgi:Na+-translocating ferredoxin:NAD+ oxidoreductase RnfC subunit